MCKHALFDEKYRAAYARMATDIAARISAGRYAAMGYTTNYDLICTLEADALNAFVHKAAPELTRASLRPVEQIETPQDLACTLAYHCLTGLGGEMDSAQLQELRQDFCWRAAIGGTAPQAAMALAAVGCPSAIHMTDHSPEVCGILSSPYIHTVDGDGHLVPVSSIPAGTIREIHWIFQFQKGGQLALADGAYEISASNRIILTQSEINRQVPLQAPYLHYVETHAKAFASNVLSSFNAMTDEALLGQRLESILRHVASYRQGNPCGIVYYEDAHYHSAGVRALCLRQLFPLSDIVSMNEEELAQTLAAIGFVLDFEDIHSYVAGAYLLKERFGVRKGLIIHTKDFALYVGEPLRANIETGLLYGNLMATAKALNGDYGTYPQLADVLTLPLSEKGLRAHAALAAKAKDMGAVLVPSRYIARPKYTIGLGDSFMAGVQICF